MTDERARATVAAFTAGIQHEGDWQPSAEEMLAAAAKRDRLASREPAWAFAVVWRHAVDEPGFELPPRSLVEMVEYLIGEPVWTPEVL